MHRRWQKNSFGWHTLHTTQESWDSTAILEGTLQHQVSAKPNPTTSPKQSNLKPKQALNSMGFFFAEVEWSLFSMGTLCFQSDQQNHHHIMYFLIFPSPHGSEQQVQYNTLFLYYNLQFSTETFHIYLKAVINKLLLLWSADHALILVFPMQRDLQNCPSLQQTTSSKYSQGPLSLSFSPANKALTVTHWRDLDFYFQTVHMQTQLKQGE